MCRRPRSSISFCGLPAKIHSGDTIGSRARLANLGHDISDQTVGNILKEHGIEPAPDRKRQTSWKTFLKAHWDVLAAIDFTAVEVWTKGGLVTYYLLFVMEIKHSSSSFRRLLADAGRRLHEANRQEPNGSI